jgi:hypothetical protein
MIITQMFGATAAVSDASTSAEGEQEDVSFPCASPMRPMIGVKIDAERRFAVRTQVTASRVSCR